MHRLINTAVALLGGLLLPYGFASAGPFDMDWNLKPHTEQDSSTHFTCANSVHTTGVCSIDAFGVGISRGSLYGAVQRSQFQVSGGTINSVSGSGSWYWHFILGGPSGFGQEVIIQTQSSPGSNLTRGAISRSSGTLPQNGSGGAANGIDPLAGIYQVDNSVTGTGTAHPRRVIVRQIVQDDEMDSTFLKGVDQNGTFQGWDTKPRIIQTLDEGEMTATVDINMSGQSYSQLDTAAPISYTLSFDTNTVANFDMATDTQKSDVTAGRYVFVGGGGEAKEYDALEGIYYYVDNGGYNLFGITGLEFRHDSENGGPYVDDNFIYPTTNPASFDDAPLIEGVGK